MSEPLDIGMPPELGVKENYTVRITALDPTTGAVVSGVTVNTVVLTADPGDTGIGVPAGDLGTWQLIPGPNA